MTDLLDVFASAAPAPVAVQGYVAAVDGDDVYAVLPSFDLTHRFGPLFGIVGSTSGLARNDPLLVIFDEVGDPWYVSPSKGGGGGGDVDVNATAHATTGAPGTAASVAVTEPTPNLFDFAFGIPRGDVGAAGAAGAPGAAGAQGPAGATGPAGPAGPEQYLRASRTADMPLSTGIDTTIICNTVDSTVGALAPLLNTSTGVVTIREAGEYTITAMGWFSDNATGRRIASIRTNVHGMVARATPGNLAGTSNPSATPNATVRLGVNDTVFMLAYQDSGTTLQFSSVALTVTKVGPGPQGPQGPPGATGGNATVPMDTWHQVGAAGEPVFQGLWVNYSGESTVAFTKDPLGRVLLRGIPRNGTANVIFILPVGYRPPNYRRYSVPGHNGTAYGLTEIDVYPTGDVRVNSGNTMNVLTGTGYVDLSVIEFDTESVTQMPTGPQGPQGPAGKNVIARGADFSGIRTVTVGSYAEINTALRCAINCTAGNFVRLHITGQWEHTVAGQYLALQVLDVTGGAVIPGGGTYASFRATAVGQNVTFVVETVLPVAASGASGYVLPGARTLTVQAQTGAATCSLRNDAAPMVFTVQELQQ